MHDGTIAGLFFITFFGLIFGLVYYYLQTRHKERMSLIEHGADAKLFQSEPRKVSYFFSMLLGILFVCLALGIGVGFAIEEWSDMDNYYRNDNPAPYFISIFFFLGLGFIASFFLHRKLILKE